MIGPQLILGLHAEAFIDNFAGGGGASTGIELAINRHVDAALNHDLEALAMHRMNHPQTLHYPEDIRSADPRKIAGGRPVGGVWFSPDCKHFSKAKGGKPRNKFIRGLAWSVIHWINAVAPRVIFLENVEEFQTWCPLLADGKPNAWRRRWFFLCFTGAMVRRGYAVEWAPGDGFVYSRTRSGTERIPDLIFSARACDYSAPTIRKRLYLIARRDGRPIVWPRPTHAAPEKSTGLKPWRTMAECIDFSLPCPSIFLTREDGRAVRCNRPLASSTLARVAKGVDRYVLKAERPFIVELTHQGNAGVASVDDPLKTVTAANRGEKALVAPVIAHAQHRGAVRSATSPIHTIAASTKDQNQLIAASVVKLRGDNVGHPVDQPGRTISAQGKHHGVIAAYIAQHNGGANGHQTVGHPATAPASTISSKGCQQQFVACSMTKYYGTDQDPRLEEPSHTVTTKDRFGFTEAVLAIPPFTPALEAGARRVAAFLRAHGVQFEGEFAMVGEYVIVDLGMRMLKPRELYLAQGFPGAYIINRGLFEHPLTKHLFEKPLTGTAQVRMCGNSVCPPMAQALVAANLPEMRVERIAA